MSSTVYKKWISVWLLVGLFMVLIQIVIGGITRLTDSGLSITEWNIIKGTLPPLNEAQWSEAFQKYKDHTVQFKAIHSDMDMGAFKFIYFWEYFHRLWARTMGFVFLFPFLFFLYKKAFDAYLIKQLIIIVLLAAFAATFGWIMVSSGIDSEHYVWVNAYKLTIHLSIAVSLLLVLSWTIFKVKFDNFNFTLKYARFSYLIFTIIVLQIIMGGFMSGMKAALVAPYYPHMGFNSDGSFYLISPILLDSSEWKFSHLTDYYNNSFAPSLVQFVHRSLAFILLIIIPYFFYLNRELKDKLWLRVRSIIISLLLIQFSLGVLTVIYSLNHFYFPILGVLHQFFGIILILSFLFVLYITHRNKTLI